MENAASVPDLRIAGARVKVDEALAALVRYPRRTPSVYDLVDGERDGLTQADVLARTRKLSSRLSAYQLSAMSQRAQDAPWAPVLDGADLATVRVGDDAWVAADRLYLHFLEPKIAGVGFAKVHKHLHLMYPAVFPIIDSRLRLLYRSPERALASHSGLVGPDHWRRRIWLAIGDDVRVNRSSGALAVLRSRLEVEATRAGEYGQAREARTLHRIGSLSDVRLLDMFSWRAGASQGRTSRSGRTPARSAASTTGGTSAAAWEREVAANTACGPDPVTRQSDTPGARWNSAAEIQPRLLVGSVMGAPSTVRPAGARSNGRAPGRPYSCALSRRRFATATNGRGPRRRGRGAGP